MGFGEAIAAPVISAALLAPQISVWPEKWHFLEVELQCGSGFRSPRAQWGPWASDAGGCFILGNALGVFLTCCFPITQGWTVPLFPHFSFLCPREAQVMLCPNST